MEYRPLLALLKGFHYTIRDISKDKACIKRVCFVRIALALCGY
ncbi:hypothetical protein HPHPP26_0602 [Helicobacter pylori Hp P-26]|nr:hypothetical protein HPHPP26_0602 [Helicobacter pylori Hp P-26]